jgi:hypothetical protein
MLHRSLRMLSLLGAGAALMLAAAAFAGSASGANFVLGATNTVNATSTLTGSTGGPQLKVTNTNTNNHGILAQSGGGSGIAIYGKHTTTAGAGPALQGESASTAAGAFSIYGLLTPTAPASPSAAIRAESKSTGANGYGLWASQAGTGVAVYGTSPSGTGVYGKHTGGAGSGPGVQGDSAAAATAGVLGRNTAGGPGLQAISNAGIPPLKVSNSVLVPSLNADKVDGLDAAGFWKTGGNAGTVAGTNYVGTSDNQALELKVNNTRALRLEPDATSPNLIGGFSGNGNPSGSGAYGLTIAGGGESFGGQNLASDNFGTIGGGFTNIAGSLDGDAGNAEQATVGGGAGNTANAFSSTIGGGDNNTASGQRSTVVGGTFNTASALQATVAGGGGNTASALDAFVAGGGDNVASGNWSFAGGRRAKATLNGSFVWGDSTNADVIAPAADTFTVRASGGTFIRGSANVTSGALSTGVAVLATNATTPSVSGGNVFTTNNSLATTITSFAGAAGQTITIVFGDGNTTIQDNGSTIFLQGAAMDFTGATNDTITLVSTTGSKWYEVSRSVN